MLSGKIEMSDKQLDRLLGCMGAADTPPQRLVHTPITWSRLHLSPRALSCHIPLDG